ncbi:MAG: TRC40/GET3/ArsA family transport-energizing ATPase [Candidatus Methanomethylophilaceae archaeon]|nr:TRC40/GET3/ArsA family transport-energizing ATPase [Candidatus Methanomethylophilaceae archaeon]
MRLIIYTGKGGVGKTSTSAATAYRLSKLGYRTILMSSDSAHSLGDSLGMKLGTEIQNVAENFDAFEIDIIHEMKTRWSEIQEYVSAFMLSQGMGDISAEEMAIFPGMEMIAALFYLNTFKKSGEYDVVILDTAPTGETLRLLSFPDVSNWYMDRLFSVLRKLIGVARLTVGKLIDMPLPSKEVLDSLEVIKRNMGEVKEILEDSENTTVRLVLNPERMIIKETMRAYTYLCLYNKNVEAIVVNRVIPAEAAAGGGFFAEKLKEQEGYMEEIHSVFDPLETKTCSMMRTELRGLEKLDLMADMIFGDEDPSKLYSSESPMEFCTVDGVDHLVMKMPFVEKADVELFRVDTSVIVVHVGSQKRNIQLPDTLVHADVVGAEFKDGKLVIRFKRRWNGLQRGRGTEVRRREQGADRGAHGPQGRLGQGRAGMRRPQSLPHGRGHGPRQGQGGRRPPQARGGRGMGARQGRPWQGEGRGRLPRDLRGVHRPGGAEALHDHGPELHHGHVRADAEDARAGLREGRRQRDGVQLEEGLLQHQLGMQRQEEDRDRRRQADRRGADIVRRGRAIRWKPRSARRP